MLFEFRVIEVIDGYTEGQMNIELELVWNPTSELIGYKEETRVYRLLFQEVCKALKRQE